MNSVNTITELNELLNGQNVHVQLSVPQLVEKATSRGEAVLTSTGAVKAETGKYTGRSPKDKYMVEEDISKDKIDWGPVNQPISSEIFDSLYKKVIDYLKTKEELFVFKGFAGADKQSRLSLQVINEYAWHNLFAHQLFIRPSAEELTTHEADFTIVSAPTFKADP
ncbi:MAG: phosphoenolpyruvate carboxykinase (ATP), partial [Firmicutes bacterium]|nr:phosphoenolpyruvate carboxykinase (ATP) [Bacillota bacterium]